MDLPSDSATSDLWFDWLMHRRHADDCDYGQRVKDAVASYADRVLDGAALKQGMTLVDLGAGDGLVGFRAIDRIGESLKVIMVDISVPLLKFAEQSANSRGVRQQCTFPVSPAEHLDAPGSSWTGRVHVQPLCNDTHLLQRTTAGGPERFWFTASEGRNIRRAPASVAEQRDLCRTSIAVPRMLCEKKEITMTTLTSNELQGRAIGAIFFAVFGTLWIGLGFYAKQLLTRVNIAFVLLVLAIIVGIATWLIRQSRRYPTMAEDPKIRRTFNLINGAQWLAVAVVVVSFVRLHLDAYIMCGISAIVALHFFPIARLFRYWVHYVTGGVLLGWALLSAMFVPVEHLQGTSALGTGIVLWVSAFTTLLLACMVAGRS
ncbi:MAG: methyltransferase domain-containing protein [Terracidiphilus sp.]